MADFAWGVVASAFLLVALALRLFDRPRPRLAPPFTSPTGKPEWSRRLSVVLWIVGWPFIAAGLYLVLAPRPVTCLVGCRPTSLWAAYGDVYVLVVLIAGLVIYASLWSRLPRRNSPAPNG